MAIAVGGCGSSSGPSGEFEGTTKLSRVYYGTERADLIGGGSGDAQFRSYDMFRFGKTTSLPDCSVSITELKEDEWIITGSTQFRGESNDGQGCRARLLSDLEFPATVEGKIKRTADGGIEVKAVFYRRDSPDSGQFRLDFAGEQKGWF